MNSKSSNQPSTFKIGDMVCFSGSFGMRSYTTRHGKILSIEDGIAKVECKQGIHTQYLSSLRMSKS